MNEEKFTGKADAYDKYRPSYPDSLVDWLYEQTSAETVADIGAGTGIFTKCLSVKPWKITAVEPNADMLEKLRANLPNAEIVNASAEDTGIAAHSIDLVTTAQAFHWFDREKFKIECQRIFSSKGRLAVIWNDRITDTDFMRERDKLCIKYCGKCHVGGSDGPTEGDHFLRNEYFSEMKFFCTDNVINMDEERFLGDMLSHSYSLKEGDENYEKFVDEMRNAFLKYQRNGTVEVPYKTTCYLGKF
ncbi:MAG: class I SAM-dependent methyltransferase [Oscillospiraceae bacterium]|nr:class I SAM-dependent methyltransferase [Oscillospiraceae bacterium]